MKINKISIYKIDLPLHKPYWLSGGRLRFDVLDSTFVCIETDDGLEGWGEGCPWGETYLPAFGSGIRAVLGLVAPQLIGSDPLKIEQLNRNMDLMLPGHEYGKSAVDMACWDILGQHSEMSVVDLLGGRYDIPVPIASSVSTGTPEQMLELIKEFRDSGYHVHSAKVGADLELDIERVKFLSREKNRDEVIFYDANRAWIPQEAISVMNAVDGGNIWFEQPCETLEQCLQVRRQTSHPICIDEGLKIFNDLLRISNEGIAEIVNIKLNRVGGLSKARRMRDFCLEAGIAMLIMETGGSVLADTATVHFAQSIPPEFIRGTWLCHEMVGPDVAEGQGARNINGDVSAPDLPGLGVKPDISILGEPVAVYE